MNCTDTITAAAHPAPPVPCDIDLRDFHFMPLDVVRLQNSETWAIADGWAAKALVNLWTRSWHQVPAGSLPDDDNLHRAWANVPDWESVRNVALRGFVKCSDGRLYHRVICEKALDAWNKRKRFRRAANARWKNEKNATDMQRTPDAPASYHATHLQGTGRGKGKRKNAADAASPRTKEVHGSACDVVDGARSRRRIAVLLKRRLSEHGVGYPDNVDRPCGLFATLSAEKCGPW
jgi:hypothetical protein